MMIEIIVLALFAIAAIFIGPKEFSEKVIYLLKAVVYLIVGTILLNCDISFWWKVLYAAFAIWGSIETGKEHEIPSPSSIVGVTIAVMFIFPGWLTALIGGVLVLIAAKDFKGY